MSTCALSLPGENRQKLVKVKDSFTPMSQEREKKRDAQVVRPEQRVTERQRMKAERDQIRTDLFALFAEPNASERGRVLQAVLDRLFKSRAILVREGSKGVRAVGEGTGPTQPQLRPALSHIVVRLTFLVWRIACTMS